MLSPSARAVTDTVAVGTSGSLNSSVSQKWGRQNVKYDACCHAGPPQRPWCLPPPHAGQACRGSLPRGMGGEVDADGRRWAFYTIRKESWVPACACFTGSCLNTGKSFLKSNHHPAAAPNDLFLTFPQQRKRTVSPHPTNHPAETVGALLAPTGPRLAPESPSSLGDRAGNWCGLLALAESGGPQFQGVQSFGRVSQSLAMARPELRHKGQSSNRPAGGRVFSFPEGRGGDARPAPDRNWSRREASPPHPHRSQEPCRLGRRGPGQSPLPRPPSRWDPSLLQTHRTKGQV